MVAVTPQKFLDTFIATQNEKQFVIPVYQRKYTWTIDKQLKQLISDLKLLVDTEGKEQHFLGTLVFIENTVDKQHTELSIVDGQQRLVTMFLIAHAMKSIAINKFRIKGIEERYLVNSEEPQSSKYYQRLFPAISDDSEYLQIANGSYDELDEHSTSNIVQNFLYLKNELTKLVTAFDFERVLYALKQFSIVPIKLKDGDNAQQIFESINSTGERLTASDLIRNFIMMNQNNESQTYLYNQYWKKLESTFTSSTSMEDFFRYYLATVTGKYTNKALLYYAFKEYWLKATNSLSAENMLSNILNYSDYYASLYFKKPSGKYMEIISDFHFFESKMPAPFMMGLYDLLHKNKISEKDFYTVMHVLNTVQFRKYFNGDDTSKVSRSYPGYLKKVQELAAKNGYEKIVDIVKYVLINKNQASGMALPTDKTLIKNMITINSYKRSQTRRLLEKIENNDNNVKIEMPELTIEHVMPQTQTAYWTKKAGVSGGEYTDLINTIGNLTLVSKTDNSTAGNRDFETKKKIFTDTMHIHMNNEICSHNDWTGADIENRSRQIAKALINIYPYPELFTRNSKIPIKHMIQVLDGDFTFSPFKCRKRASALV